MSHLTTITTAAHQSTSNRFGLRQMDANLAEALLSAEKAGALTLTAHNANYCTLQGVWDTPAALISHASHFEFYSEDVIMLKQGGRKMRAFKISAE